MAEQWLSIVEYARTFSISDMTIRRRIRTGKLKAVLREGKYFIPVQTDPVTKGYVKPSGRDDDMPPVHVGNKYSGERRSLHKSHPHAEHTYPHVMPPREQERHMSHNFAVEREMLPPRQSAPMLDRVSVEAQEFLDYCRSSLQKLSQLEREIRISSEEKIRSAEEKVKRQDLEICTLKQQLEDLQLLVKLLEKKNSR